MATDRDTRGHPSDDGWPAGRSGVRSARRIQLERRDRYESRHELPERHASPSTEHCRPVGGERPADGSREPAPEQGHGMGRIGPACPRPRRPPAVQITPGADLQVGTHRPMVRGEPPSGDVGSGRSTGAWPRCRDARDLARTARSSTMPTHCCVPTRRIRSTSIAAALFLSVGLHRADQPCRHPPVPIGRTRLGVDFAGSAGACGAWRRAGGDMDAAGELDGGRGKLNASGERARHGARFRRDAATSVR